MATFRSVALRDRQSKAVFPFSVISVALTGLVSYVPAYAQQTDDEPIEEISVTGTRAKIQSIVNIKRSSTTIVDGLSATDFGDRPALSIGEALESVTGAASVRSSQCNDSHGELAG